MPLRSRLDQKPSALIEIFGLYLLVVLASRVFDPSIGVVLLLVATMFLSGPLLPGKHLIQKYSAVAVLYVGLSPSYLLIRGLFSKSNLNKWDLQIYSLLFLILVLIWMFFSKSIEEFKQPLFTKERVQILFSSLFGMIAFFAVLLYLRFQSMGHAVAWVSSGDSKNHFVNGVTLTELGFLNPQSFLIQPSSSPTYLALVLSQFSSGINQAVLSMPNLMYLYAIVWVVLVGILGMSFASMTQFVWSSVNKARGKVPLHLIAISSVIPMLSFVLGPALYDGFFTAIFGISAGVVLTAWYFESAEKNKFSISFSLLGLLIFLSTITAWMFIVPFTVLIYLLGQRNLLKNLASSGKFIDFAIFLLGIILVVLIKTSDFIQGLIYQAKLALTASGAVNASSPEFYFSLIALLIVIGQILLIKKIYLGKAFLYLAFIQVTALFIFKNFSNLGFFDWNYYLLKYQWIMFSILISVIFSFLVISIQKIFKTNRQSYLISLSLVACLVFVASESVVSTNRIWKKIWTGWENPRSSIMNQMLNEKINRSNPTMFFHFGYGGDSRLANFWLTAFADPLDPIKGWNYTIDTTGDPKQLCDVNAYYPQVKVITSDIKLEQELIRLCGSEEFIVDLRPSII